MSSAFLTDLNFLNDRNLEFSDLKSQSLTSGLFLSSQTSSSFLPPCLPPSPLLFFNWYNQDLLKGYSAEIVQREDLFTLTLVQSWHLVGYAILLFLTVICPVPVSPSFPPLASIPPYKRPTNRTDQSVPHNSLHSGFFFFLTKSMAGISLLYNQNYSSKWKFHFLS